MAYVIGTGVAVHIIREIVASATEFVLLVTADLDVPDEILHSIEGTAARQVPIAVVCRDRAIEGKDEKVAPLLGVPGLSVYTSKRNHAKCYLNEQRGLVGSLNLLKSSMQNREICAHLDAASDDQPFCSACGEHHSREYQVFCHRCGEFTWERDLLTRYRSLCTPCNMNQGPPRA